MTRREQLHFLITALQREMPEYAVHNLPEDEAAAFDLFRTLCNLRRPGAPKLPEAFYATERDGGPSPKRRASRKVTPSHR